MNNQFTFEEAKKESERTGFGVTENDLMKGVSTIDQKLNQMCTYFPLMNELYGERQNVCPSYTINSTDLVNLTEHVEEDYEEHVEEHVDDSESKTSESKNLYLTFKFKFQI